jgi:hypothetical protein
VRRGERRDIKRRKAVRLLVEIEKKRNQITFRSKGKQKNILEGKGCKENIQ